MEGGGDEYIEDDLQVTMRVSLGLTINFNILQSHLVVMPICWQQHIIRRQGGKMEQEKAQRS